MENFSKRKIKEKTEDIIIFESTAYFRFLFVWKNPFAKYFKKTNIADLLGMIVQKLRVTVEDLKLSGRFI